MKSVFTKVSAITSALVATPVLAHSEHGSVMSGIVHFMTEPDHLAISALVAAAVIYAVRKVSSKRT
ncbi:MAG: hypothetical protein K6L74_05140 [Neptuniibacter sp.]